jgi:hypothetical protein
MVVDETDSDTAAITGTNPVDVHGTNILMKTADDRMRVARAALSVACPEILRAAVAEVE